MDDGTLIVRLVDAKVKGEPVPAQFIDAISADNLAADLYNDPDNKALLQKFETIEVRDGAVRLRLKEEVVQATAPGGDEESPTSPDAEPEPASP